MRRGAEIHGRYHQGGTEEDDRADDAGSSELGGVDIDVTSRFKRDKEGDPKDMTITEDTTLRRMSVRVYVMITPFYRRLV